MEGRPTAAHPIGVSAPPCQAPRALKSFERRRTPLGEWVSAGDAGTAPGRRARMRFNFLSQTTLTQSAMYAQFCVRQTYVSEPKQSFFFDMGRPWEGGLYEGG